MKRIEWRANFGFGLVLIMILSQSAAHAQGPALNYSASQLAMFAQAAVVDEVGELNRAIGFGDEPEDYSSGALRTLIQAGKTSIDPEYVSEKCVFNENDLSSVLSSRLGNGDDSVSMKKNALSSIKNLHGAKVWKLISKICVNARTRFVSRLESATHDGISIPIQDEVIEKTAKLMFYPTDHGRPSLRKSADSAFNALLGGAMVVGATSSLIGIPVGGVSLVVITLAMGARTTLGLFSGSEKAFLNQLKITEVDSFETRFDLTSTEVALSSSGLRVRPGAVVSNAGRVK